MRSSLISGSNLFNILKQNCTQLAAGKIWQINCDWLIWNWGWNLKSLNHCGEWGKDKRTTWTPTGKIGLAGEHQNSTHELCSSLNGEDPSGYDSMGSGSAVYLIVHSPLCFPIPSAKWQAVPWVNQGGEGVISDTPYQFPISKINGEVSRKLEVAPISTAFLPPPCSFCFSL